MVRRRAVGILGRLGRLEFQAQKLGPASLQLGINPGRSSKRASIGRPGRGPASAGSSKRRARSGGHRHPAAGNVR